VLDRMDEAILFDLPGLEQRGRLLRLYLDRYITKAGTAEVRGVCCCSGGLAQLLSTAGS
jgi:hypothetical protein